jgi:hypothetical protein
VEYKGILFAFANAIELEMVELSPEQCVRGGFHISYGTNEILIRSKGIRHNIEFFVIENFKEPILTIFAGALLDIHQKPSHEF